MTSESKELCAIAMGLKPIDRCCGTCKYLSTGWEGETGCTHPKQMEFADDDDRERAEGGMEPFGVDGFGVRNHFDMVCDLWERDTYK